MSNFRKSWAQQFEEGDPAMMDTVTQEAPGSPQDNPEDGALMVSVMQEIIAGRFNSEKQGVQE